MKSNQTQKTILSLAIIVALVVLALVFRPADDNGPELYAGWKVYADPATNLSFQYLPAWGKVKTGPDGIIFSDNQHVRVLFKFVSIIGDLLRQYALISDVAFQQTFPEIYGPAVDRDAYLQSILDHSADPSVLEKIDTFEGVILTLTPEIK